MSKKIIIGIANFSNEYILGKKTIKNYKKLLDDAHDLGFNQIELAEGYLNISPYLQNTKRKWNIQYKFRYSLESYEFYKEKYLVNLGQKIREVVQNHQLGSIVFHDVNDLGDMTPGKYEIELLKSNSTADLIGLSLYPEQFALQHLEWCQIIQLPLNILDRRIFHNGTYNLIVPKNVTLQVRSIYLRGILTDQYRQIQRFSTAASKFHDLCSKYGYDPALIAFKYVKKFAPESTIVLGIDSEIQLRKLISWESQAINEDFLEIINEIYEDRVEFIDPRYWRN